MPLRTAGCCRCRAPVQGAAVDALRVLWSLGPLQGALCFRRWCPCRVPLGAAVKVLCLLWNLDAGAAARRCNQSALCTLGLGCCAGRRCLLGTAALSAGCSRKRLHAAEEYLLLSGAYGGVISNLQ